MNIERPLVRVPKTAELIAQDIRRQIVHGDVLEDDALPSEQALMERYGISRPTLREAFRILESERLIVVRRGARGGARVRIPTSDVAARYAALVLQHRGATVADVLEVRAVVEAPAARWLAQRRDRVSVAKQLLKFHESVDLSVDPLRFGEFNALLVRLTENEALILITTMLEDLTRTVTRAYLAKQHRDATRMRGQVDRTRRRIVEHIRLGEADEAEALYLRHLQGAGAVLGGTVGTIIDAFTME